MREIERQNHILLRKITSQKPTYTMKPESQLQKQVSKNKWNYPVVKNYLISNLNNFDFVWIITDHWANEEATYKRSRES